MLAVMIVHLVTMYSNLYLYCFFYYYSTMLFVKLLVANDYQIKVSILY